MWGLLKKQWLSTTNRTNPLGDLPPQPNLNLHLQEAARRGETRVNEEQVAIRSKCAIPLPVGFEEFEKTLESPIPVPGKQQVPRSRVMVHDVH